MLKDQFMLRKAAHQTWVEEIIPEFEFALDALTNKETYQNAFESLMANADKLDGGVQAIIDYVLGLDEAPPLMIVVVSILTELIKETADDLSKIATESF